MDAFTVVFGGTLAFFVILVLLLGVFSQRSARDYLDWKPTRSPEVEAQNEVDDIAQMLEATNERRVRRGLDPLTEDGITQRVHSDKREIAKMREQHTLDLELEQVLEARNERRRKRGLPEMTIEELRESLDVRPPS